MEMKFKSEQDMKDYLNDGYTCVDLNGNFAFISECKYTYMLKDKNGLLKNERNEQITKRFYDFEVVKKINQHLFYQDHIEKLQEKIFALETNNKKLVEELKHKKEYDQQDIQDKVYDVFNAIESLLKEAIIKVLCE
jgi:hypothetical protein